MCDAHEFYVVSLKISARRYISDAFMLRVRFEILAWDIHKSTTIDTLQDHLCLTVWLQTTCTETHDTKMP